MDRGPLVSRRIMVAALAVAPTLCQSARGQTAAERQICDSAISGGSVRRREDAATEISQSIQNEQVIYPANFGMSGQYEQDATEQMQRMFDQIPDGSVVDFAHGFDFGGDYRITDSVVIRRSISLRGRNSRIVGVMRNDVTDLIRYQPKAELRGITVEGMRLAFNSGGRDALVFDGGNIGVIENVVSRCSISGGAGGYAIHMAGLGNHFNVVRDCTLVGTESKTGAVFIGSADGNKLYDNVITGIGTGVHLHLVNGAYKTAIIGGAITARDVGIYISAGQQIDIERVQFEQGRGNVNSDRNQSMYASHIVIDGSGIFPAGEEVRDVRIVACNFGGGSNQDSALTLVKHTRDVIIDENYFAAPGKSGTDIRIISSEVFWTLVGPNNRVGGVRLGIQRGRNNSVDPKDLLVTADGGTGTYGVYKNADALALSNGWAAQAGFAFWKNADDILRLRSTISAGAILPGTLIGTLPPGYRPRTELRISVPTDNDQIDARLAVSVAGLVTVRNVAAGAILYLDQLAIPIKGRTSFVSGPY